MTKRLVIVLRNVRATVTSSPHTVTLLSYNIAPRNWRKKTNKILNSIMSLWKTSLNRNFFSWKQRYAKLRREWWGTWTFSAHANLSVVYVFSFTFRKWVIQVLIISSKESHELKISLDVPVNILWPHATVKIINWWSWHSE